MKNLEKVLTGLGIVTIGLLALDDSESSIGTNSNYNTTNIKTQSISKTYQSSNNKCHPSYGGCLRMNAGDYDCAGGSGNGPYYTGKVRVLGYDEFGLDRDNDGWGCE